MSDFQRPFRVGDVVRYGASETTIVEEVKLDSGGDLIYAVLEKAWLRHDDLTLVRDCDEASMQALRDAIE